MNFCTENMPGLTTKRVPCVSVPQVPLGKPCNPRDEAPCQDPQAECRRGLCQCSGEFYEAGGACGELSFPNVATPLESENGTIQNNLCTTEPRGTPGAPCLPPPTQCLDAQSECRQGTCQCIPGYYLKDSRCREYQG